MSVGKSRWEAVGYVISSGCRVLVPERLIESPAMPVRVAAAEVRR